MIGAWKMFKDDPLGPMSIKVTIKGNTAAEFQWLLTNE